MDALREDCYWFCREYHIKADDNELNLMARFARDNMAEGMDKEDAISYASEFLR